MEQFNSFFLAETGATASLIGLLFVALSINLQKITLHKQLVNKALATFLLLIFVFIISSISLIPHQPIPMFGIEIFLISTIIWGVLLNVHAKTFNKNYQKHFKINFILNQLATLPFLIGAIFLFLGNTTGYYWLIPGILISILVVAINSWVLLVEINRS